MVKWAGHDTPTWEPQENLDCARLVQEYESRLSKVSWPTKTELVRGSMVVLITILFLAGFLFMFDFIWAMVFKYLGIVG